VVSNDGSFLGGIMLTSLLLFLNIALAGDSDIEVIVKGMVCSFCVQGVEKKFSKEESVEKIAVDLEQSLVSIWLKENQSLSDDRITDLIKDAGYNVETIKRQPEKSKSEEK
jgi:periplasmic mercuric ion binding protein